MDYQTTMEMVIWKLSSDEHTPGTSVYDDYMKVQNGQRFDYVNVWRNQTNDVHPPLYYALIHTICSVFPNKFSKWFAAGINVICSADTIYGKKNNKSVHG